MATPGRQAIRGAPRGAPGTRGEHPVPSGAPLVCTHGPTAKVGTGTGSLQQVQYTSYDKRLLHGYTAILVMGGSAVPRWHGSVRQRMAESRYRSWATDRTLRSAVRSPWPLHTIPGFLVDHSEVRTVCVCGGVWYGSPLASGQTPQCWHQGARTWHVARGP